MSEPIHWLSPLKTENANEEIYQVKVRDLDQILEIRQLARKCGGGVSHSKKMRITFDVATIDGRMGRDDFLGHLPRGILLNRIK